MNISSNNNDEKMIKTEDKSDNKDDDAATATATATWSL